MMMYYEVRRNSVSWRNLSRGGIRRSRSLRGFMLFGDILNDPEPSVRFMLLCRICIATPPSDDLLLDKGIFKMIQKHGKCTNHYSQTRVTITTVPTIIVFTKFDLFVSQLAKQGRQPVNGESIQEFAEKEFQKRYGQELEASIKSGSGEIPYTFVASKSTFFCHLVCVDRLCSIAPWNSTAASQHHNGQSF